MLITYNVIALFIVVEKEKKYKPVYFYCNLGQSVVVTKIRKQNKLLDYFYVTILSIFPNFSSLEK